MAKKVKGRVKSESGQAVRVVQMCTLDGLGTHIPVGREFTISQVGGIETAKRLVQSGFFEFVTTEAE